MSRSRRKTPVCKWYGQFHTSEKWWKDYWHRWMRAHSRIRLHILDEDTYLLPHQRDIPIGREVGNDGKKRFDPREFPKLMRK